MAVSLNQKAVRWARGRIKAGKFERNAPLDPTDVASEGPEHIAHRYLGCEVPEQPDSGELRYLYPFVRTGDDGPRVYRSALVAAWRSAAEAGHPDIHAAAGRLLELVDDQQGRASGEQRRAYTGIDVARDTARRDAGSLVFPTVDGFELRAEGDDDSPTLVGYAAVFEQLSEEMWWGREKIRKGAFAASIKAGDDVIANLEHEGGLNVIGRRSNDTLTLTEDDHGLRVEIKPPDTQTGRDAVELVRKGFLTQMSFAFRVVKQELDDSDNDELLRTLIQVDLYDVAIVAMPAYSQTTVESNAAPAEPAASATERTYPAEPFARRLQSREDDFEGRLRSRELVKT